MATKEKKTPAVKGGNVKELDVRQLQQLRFEIEGKVITNNTTNERTQEMDGILRAKNFSQREKIELRKKSKEIEGLLETIGKQEEALYGDFFENFGTSEAKVKDNSPEAKKAFENEMNNLITSKHPIAKVGGITIGQIDAVKDTSDFYEILYELQS